MTVLATLAWLLGTRLAYSAHPVTPVEARSGHTSVQSVETGAGAAPEEALAAAAGAGAPESSHELGSGADGQSVYHPRDPREWQGMPVDMEFLQPYCGRPEDCGMALGCLGERGCGPCTATEGCSSNEVCALDHCVPSGLAHCRSYRDCPNGEHCLLTGISPDARGNAEMSALCAGELQQHPEVPQPPPQPRTVPFHSPNEDLRRTLEQ